MTAAAHPNQYAGEFVLHDGTHIRLRCVKPEDETLLQELVDHMTRQDVRFRFLGSMQRLPHDLAERLSRIDYDRDMALIAFPCDEEIPLGVGRYSRDDGIASVEFAVAVRSDWKDRGLGYLLMSRLMEIARQHGIKEFYGIIDGDNEHMLQLCRSFGFTFTRLEQVPWLVRASKTLQTDS